MRQEVIIYPGAINNIEKILTTQSSVNILLVRGHQSYIKSGAKDSLRPILEKYKVTEFSGFSINPKLEEAKNGYDLFKRNKSNLIIAVGGGSVIDTAKIIKYLAIQEDSENVAKPFIAIPTTAGTGSEATHFAVVYINDIKHSFANEFLLPTVAVVDANLIKGQSAYQMAVSGIDALAQGIESYWSIHSTDESMKYAEKAIELVWENLENAIQGDRSASINLAKGSYNAGKAINITKTTAPHALSYGFTSKFDLPHGHAVALFLPFFIKYHKQLTADQCLDYRGITFLNNQLVRIASFLNVNFDVLEKEVISFFSRLGISISFSELEITRNDFQNAIKGLNQDRLNNNPGTINFDLITNIYSFNNNAYD